MNILFACDLDNTLIHSFKHKCEGDVCIEMLKDKEQGFISPNTGSLLSDVMERVNFIPVTTRSVEQYGRIKWLDNIKPRYAVSTNGAIFLDNYTKDSDWFEESERYSKAVYTELLNIQKLLTAQDRFIKCRIVDDMYLFAYCKSEVDVDKCVEEYRIFTKLNVVASGKKIYFFPYEINKGAAVERLKKIFRPQITICAGDSEIDIPMLNIADIAIVPSASMAEKVKNNNIYINCEDRFSEYVLKTVLEICKLQ